MIVPDDSFISDDEEEYWYVFSFPRGQRRDKTITN